MQRKKIILIVMFVLLVSASGIIVYRSYNPQPFTIIPKTVSTRDIEITDQVESLKIKITKAIREVEDGGALDQLVQGKQFEELTTQFLKPIVIGAYGRANPFVPPQLGQ